MTEQESPNGFAGEFEKNIVLTFSKEQFPVVVERNFEVRQGIDDFMESRTNGVLKMELQNASDFGPTIARLEQIANDLIGTDVTEVTFNTWF